MGIPVRPSMEVFGLLAFIATLGLVHAKCKPGWVSWGGRCFYMSTGTKNWWDAKQDCIRRGGRLFEPRNKEVNELVYSKSLCPTLTLFLSRTKRSASIRLTS